jgi:hypothetical protein
LDGYSEFLNFWYWPKIRILGVKLELLAEGIDLLGEVPVQEINSVPFRERRWPQLPAAQSRLAKKNVGLVKRRAQPLETKRNRHAAADSLRR